MNLKKCFSILCVFVGSLTNTQAQSNDVTFYFMRYTGYQGSAISFTTFMDGQLVCKLNNKSFSTHKTTPGKHTFAVQFAGKEAKEKAELITIDMEGGKTYYIQLILQNG